MYKLAPEVEEVAKPLIDSYHRHLLEAKVTFVFRDRAWKKGDGRTVLGKAAKRNELDELLSERKEDFVIMIAEEKWNDMDDDHRKSLVDHEICHCGVVVDQAGEKKWIIRDHPIQEFPENLARFEFRRHDISHLIENPTSAVMAKQSPLRKIITAAEEV